MNVSVGFLPFYKRAYLEEPSIRIVFTLALMVTFGILSGAFRLVDSGPLGTVLEITVLSLFIFGIVWLNLLHFIFKYRKVKKEELSNEKASLSHEFKVLVYETIKALETNDKVTIRENSNKLPDTLRDILKLRGKNKILKDLSVVCETFLKSSQASNEMVDLNIYSEPASKTTPGDTINIDYVMSSGEKGRLAFDFV